MHPWKVILKGIQYELQIAFNVLAVMDTSFDHLPFFQIYFQINKDAISQSTRFLLPFLLLSFLLKKLVSDLSKSHTGKDVMQVLEVVWQSGNIYLYHKQIVHLVFKLFRTLAPDIFK